MNTRSTPDFLKAQTPWQLPQINWRRWLALIALCALLAVQVLVADRARLSQSERWRPWVERACGVLQCEVPLWYQPSAFQINSRDIQPHPSVPGALMVRASIENTARYAQAWPQIELSMSDMDDRRMGLRRFQVEEYLGSTPESVTIAPGQLANLTLEILDPGKRAVAFSFEFY
jgi:hypothetical protein